MQQKQKAVIYMMISVILFSLMQLFISMTSPAANIFQQVFFRNFLGMGICIYYIRKEKQTEKIPYFGDLKSQPYLLGRSLFGFLGLLLMFYATRHALLADVTILTRTGPLFTTLVAVFFLHEKLPRIQIPVLVVIFAGGWLAANPTFDSSFLPLGCALLSAVCNGICYPLLRFSREKEHAMTVIMHFSTFCVIACIPFLIQNFSIPQGMDIIFLLLIALTGAWGQIFLTYAYRLSPAAEIAIYDQFSVVFSIILGYLFLHQIPSWHSLAGGALIVGASLSAYLYNTKKGT